MADYYGLQLKKGDSMRKYLKAATKLTLALLMAILVLQVNVYGINNITSGIAIDEDIINILVLTSDGMEVDSSIAYKI